MTDWKWRIYKEHYLHSSLPASCPRSYDSEGRLTNVTFPTGVVTNLHGDMSSGAVAVDIETSGRDEDVSITTNLSSIDSFYTLVQGKALTQVCLNESLLQLRFRG